MGWLDDRDVTAEYVCEITGEREYIKFKCSDPIPPPPTKEGFNFRYVGFVPEKMGGVTKVEYEHNGRKGIRVTDSSGGVQHRAKSKETYLKTGKIPEDVPQSRDSIVEKHNVAAKQFMQSMTQP